MRDHGTSAGGEISSFELLDAIFEAAPVGLGAWDRDFRFVRVNQRLAEINGLPAHLHIGKRPDEILPDVKGLPAVYARWKKILETGEPWLDVEINGATPASPGVERSWREHFYPIYKGQDIIGIAAVVEETTEQSRTRQQLKDTEQQFRTTRLSELRYRTLVEATGAITWSCPPSGTNDAPQPDWMAFTGQSADQMLGEGWANAIHPEDIERVAEAWKQAVRAASVFSSEHRIRRVDGQWRWMSVQAVPIRDDQGRMIEWFSTSVDVTERRRHQEHVELLMREVNHRSKNMLALIQVIARQTASKRSGDFIPRFNSRLQALADSQDLLIQNEWRAVPLLELLRSHLSHFGDLVGSRIILDGPALSVLPSTSQILGMCVHELATNAAKYGALSNERGRVLIGWQVSTSEPATFTFTWREEGGPSAKVPTKRGFGSKLTSEMVEFSLGAQVNVDYAADGLSWQLVCPSGSVLEGLDESPLHDHASFQRPGRKKQHNRVLVVEDEPLIAADVASLLLGAGLRVVGPTPSVAHALALIEHVGCDAAVLDVRLKDETSEPIAKTLAAKGVPFIVISGYGPQQLPEFMRSSPLIEKPLPSPFLLEQVKRCLDPKA